MFGNFFDQVGTTLNLPEFGISEFLNGGKNTQNSGRISGSGLNTVKQGVGVVGRPLGVQPKSQPTTNQSKNVGVKQPSTNRTAQTSAQQTTGGTNYYTGGQVGASAPAYDPQVIAQLDQSISLLNDALGRNTNQLGIAKGNIGKQYQTSVNELNTAKSSNQNNYKTSSTQNQQSLRSNRNAILDQQSGLLRGLQRQLGAYGAVGSDLGLASGAAQDIATQQNSDAGQTFAQNQQNLDTNWNNYLNEWANSKKKADDWRTSQLQNAESQSLSNRQDLLSQLADIRGRKAAALGGNYTGGAAGDLSAARSLSSRIDNLGRLNPTYNGVTPTYTAPTLDSYATPDAAAVDAGNIANNTTANNSLALLLGLDQQDQQRQPLF